MAFVAFCRATMAETGSSRVVIGIFLNSESNIQRAFKFSRINADNVVSVDCAQ